MFGMLDYRAHKLYLLMFGIPWFVIRWSAIIGLPFFYYAIGLQLANIRFFQIVITLLALFIVEIVVALVASYLDKLFMFIFTIFIDIIPFNDRTKEESITVVKFGDVGIKLIELGKKHPKEWTDEDIAFYHRGFFASFFKDTIEKRLTSVKKYFTENQEIEFTQWNVKVFLTNNKLSITLLETWVTNANYRAATISYLITLVLMISNPWR
jgi:hypothetical protein